MVSKKSLKSITVYKQCGEIMPGRVNGNIRFFKEGDGILGHKLTSVVEAISW